ncbi:hypothetical protein [Natronobacterium texcoconense]|uniref:hypothetical protein n=1 Tax=Natronobacterium texcoconense TaxID=1095778 RepID=UPI000B8487E0|nr:hypothetical protein [Natronobacterium texcoconense]
MEFPTPDPTEHVKTIAVVLATLAVLQYAGILFENPSELDIVYLVSVGFVLPIAIYLLSVLGENTKRIPDWVSMNMK